MLGKLLQRVASVPPAVFKGVNINYVGNSQIGVIKPAAASIDDLLGLLVVGIPGGTLPTTPAGWTQKGFAINATYGTRTYFYTKVCQAGDPGTSQNVNFNTSGTLGAICFAYSKSIDSPVSNGTMIANIPWNAPSITTTKKNKRVVCIWMSVQISFTGLVLPAGVTQRLYTTGLNGGNNTFIMADFLQAVAGATPVKTISTSGSDSSEAGWQIQV
jgi:hypothetical protein